MVVYVKGEFILRGFCIDAIYLNLFYLCGYLYNIFIDFQYSHQMMELDAQTYQQLAQAGDRVPFEPLMDPMLIPRVAGTENHAKVKQV